MIGYLPLDKLQAIMPKAGARAQRFLVPLNAALGIFAIHTIPRIAQFLAQIAVESGELRYTREIWGPTSTQRRYEGRADLGNTEPGDGERYMGRGLIQLTGRHNYTVCSAELGIDVVNNPHMLEQPLLAALSAGWYWDARRINEAADANDIVRVTKLVNGGKTALPLRAAYFQTAMTVLTL